ncbi:hypothetical protein ES703_13122 [subsurface metagenome]
MSQQHESALQIERHATEAIEGLRAQGATADTEKHLIDIKTLAHDLAIELQPAQAESSEPGEL